MIHRLASEPVTLCRFTISTDRLADENRRQRLYGTSLFHKLSGPAALALGLGLSLALAATTLGACSDGMQVGSVHVKSGTVGPGGGQLAITAADHAQLAGTSITFPPGALAQSTYIAIGISDANLALDDARASGPTLYFEPVGLDLAAPARLTVPFDKGADASKVLVRVLAGSEVRDVTERVVTVDRDAALITFELDRLGHVQPQIVFLNPIDAPCNGVLCPPAVDAGCAPGTQCPPIDAGVPVDAPPGGSCPLLCPPGTQCTPGTNTCIAVCNNMICPQGQGCNQDDICVNQCGMGGVVTFLCPPNQICDFGTGTCHP
jgi:hypothetical protein